jgi:predicted acyl esterase
MTQSGRRELGLPEAGDHAPIDYDRAPTYDRLIAEKDVAVPMRDGVNLSIDIYRPDSTEKFPAMLAFSIYNKDLQGPAAAAAGSGIATI